eukprot:scaffold82613_cov33-Tisochrysis_lutea.AAC.2
MSEKPFGHISVSEEPMANGRSLTQVPSPRATINPDSSPSRSSVIENANTALPPASRTCMERGKGMVRWRSRIL